MANDLQNPYAQAHEQPNGSGDARPTALKVVEDLGLRDQLTDKCFLVTGSSSGIGVETVRALYTTGAKVLMQVRNVEKGTKVLEEIKANTPSRGSLQLIEISLDSLQSIREGAKVVLERTYRSIARANQQRRRPEYTRGSDGRWLLKDLLLTSSTPQFASRVINVTSGAHRRSPVLLDNPNLEGVYEPRLGYACSKTANIWMANHIERLYGGRGLHALSVHPGCILSGLQGDMDQEAIQKRLAEDAELRQALKSTGQGAATQVWAAIAPVWEGQGARYLEDMREGHPTDAPSMLWGGYCPFIFGEENEARLWQISNEMVDFREP